jgi:hypothetical protein
VGLEPCGTAKLFRFQGRVQGSYEFGTISANSCQNLMKAAKYMHLLRDNTRFSFAIPARTNIL